ncbi:hypothetical protein DCM90_04680 [Levilactobacillus bambusae]|uniref:Uncharacterized protein n=2 Tax=Levilactobacillus bambusae TaxID=2024736 RepID=A0A2V1MYZ4_9LACO|nr:hypothetical protein DCM90_04680 [Levilactobacillus bambusae]
MVKTNQGGIGMDFDRLRTDANAAADKAKEAADNAKVQVNGAKDKAEEAVENERAKHQTADLKNQN